MGTNEVDISFALFLILLKGHNKQKRPMLLNANKKNNNNNKSLEASCRTPMPAFVQTLRQEGTVPVFTSAADSFAIRSTVSLSVANCKNCCRCRSSLLI